MDLHDMSDGNHAIAHCVHCVLHCCHLTVLTVAHFPGRLCPSVACSIPKWCSTRLCMKDFIHRRVSVTSSSRKKPKTFQGHFKLVEDKHRS